MDQYKGPFILLLILAGLIAILVTIIGQKAQQWLGRFIPAPANTRGFLEIPSREGPWLLSVNAIAKVQKNVKGQPVITLLIPDKTGAEEEIVVNMNYSDLVKEVKRAANTR